MPFVCVSAQGCVTVLSLPRDTAGEKAWIATQCRILDVQNFGYAEIAAV